MQWGLSEKRAYEGRECRMLDQWLRKGRGQTNGNCKFGRSECVNQILPKRHLKRIKRRRRGKGMRNKELKNEGRQRGIELC
jgi:hypothetical protein